MKRIAALVLAAAMAAGAKAAPAEDVAALAWIAGSWVTEKNGETVRETWLTPKDGAMAGAGQTNGRGKPAMFEFMTITAEPAGATYTARPPGQDPTPFVLKPGDRTREAVFENLGHDFPQRVIYRRCGEDLCARIEGMLGGKLEGEAWRYRRVRP